MLPEELDLGDPNTIIVLSGKRKSGKDFVANLLLERYGCENCVIVRLSGPLKERYALENDLDYQKLLDASEYKEIFRQKMIKWGEEIRNQDPSYFCRHALVQSNAKSKKVWIVSDARRTSDVQFFIDYFPDATYTVRIEASDTVRKERGWKFSKGVDDCESECGLDNYSEWHFSVLNDDQLQLMEDLDKLFLLAASRSAI